jgi:predicted acetyltransferase
MADVIRNIENEEAEESLRLSEFAFQYELSHEERLNRTAQFQSKYNWGYYVDDQLAAKLTILPLQTYLYGEIFKMGGIAGVATWPEFRRHGMVKKLLLHGLQIMKNQGQTLSFLAPFEFSFYRKFGWETYVDYKKYEVEKINLPKWSEVTGQMKRTNDWRLLQSIYEAYAPTFNGMLVRDEAWWTRRIFAIKPGTASVYYNESGKPTGYVYYQLKKKEMDIHELVFLDEQARKGLWKFIADHDSMMDKVVLKAPSNDALPFLLANPRIKQETVAYFMARIVDVEAFLEQFPFAASSEKRKFELQLSDEHAPWNDGFFSLKVNASGKAKVKRAETAETRKDKGISSSLSCDIGTLTTLLLGYQRPSFLHSIGRLHAETAVIAELEALLPEKTTYLLDFF